MTDQYKMQQQMHSFRQVKQRKNFYNQEHLVIKKSCLQGISTGDAILIFGKKNIQTKRINK